MKNKLLTSIAIGASMMTLHTICKAAPTDSSVPETVNIEKEVSASEVSASASSTFQAIQPAGNLVNGSGMTGNFHGNAGVGTGMWHSVVNPAKANIEGVSAGSWVRFDFKSLQSVDRVLVWNHNQAGLTNRGFRKVQILGTKDGKSWKNIANTELPMANGQKGEASVVKLGSKMELKGVIIAAESNWGGNVYGLSEVKFRANEVAKTADLAFPTSMEVTAQDKYRHRKDGKAGREIKVKLNERLYLSSVVEVLIAGVEAKESTKLEFDKKGYSEITVLLPEGVGVEEDAAISLKLKSSGSEIMKAVAVPKLRQWTVYIYPHSHVDIGYTNIHSNIEIIHKRNLIEGMKLAEETKDYPEGARYVWNPECTWPVERYLATATPEEKEKLYDAIRKGHIAIDAGYVSVNTSVSTDEEFPSLFSYAKKLEKETGVKVTTIGQFDVPGMSWGMVPMAAQHGMKYVFCPFNGGDRTGLSPEASFRPFYWEGPDGVSKLLFLQPGSYIPGAVLKGFQFWPGMAGQLDPNKLLRVVKTANPRANFIDGYLWGTLAGLQKDKDYPYDIFPMTWAMADNTPIDADLPDAVKSWNEEYAFPKLIIANSDTIMSAFDDKYGDIIPTRRGDFTEFWTDGLGSAAKFTGMNRNSKEKLIQADTLWSMLRATDAAPRKIFTESWRRALMGSEHTWCYMNPYLSQMQDPIWASKKEQFEVAKAGSEKTLALATEKVSVAKSEIVTVYNTLSWARHGLVILTETQSKSGSVVVASQGGTKLPSQKLSNGRLAFLTEDIEALGSASFQIKKGSAKAFGKGACTVTKTTLENGLIKLQIDPNTGDIVSLINKKTGYDFVDKEAPCGLNSYRYLLGHGAPASGAPQYASAGKKVAVPLVASTAKATGPTEVKIKIKENGPLVASLLITSKADGCNSLTREIRIIAGQDHVELDNLVDKIATNTKEGIHFGFAFNIENPRTRVDIPWGIMEVEKDQMPFGNRNWICFQRWLDVSNDKQGVTWCSLDAPTFEHGAMTANLLGSATGSPAWIRKLEPSATVYSWALNNHWHTNFPLSQGGKIQFRYRLRPHNNGYDAVKSNRFGLSQTQPLIAVTTKSAKKLAPRFTVDNPNIFVTIVKTVEEGKATIIRFRSVSDKKEVVKLTYPQKQPKAVRMSDATEIPGKVLKGDLEMLPFGVTTIYLEN